MVGGLWANSLKTMLPCSIYVLPFIQILHGDGLDMSIGHFTNSLQSQSKGADLKGYCLWLHRLFPYVMNIVDL